jgi:hypothetical protein
MSEMTVSPTALAHGAGQMLDAAARFDELTAPLLARLDLPGGAGGDLPAAVDLAEAHQHIAAELATALGRLREAFEVDADRLYQIAFAAQACDEAAARRLRLLGRRDVVPQLW